MVGLKNLIVAAERISSKYLDGERSGREVGKTSVYSPGSGWEGRSKAEPITLA
jgi:hypothetical protein